MSEKCHERKWTTCPAVRTSIGLRRPKTLEEAMATALELEMSAFLNRYKEAFLTWDGDKIAEFYCVPTITMRADGSIHCFLSREEIVRFFRVVTDTYKGEATTGADATDLVAVPLGERSALATVTWTNLRADGSVARQFRQSYNVVRIAEGWRILAATVHLNAAKGH
jgi:hypothetical protein